MELIALVAPMLALVSDREWFADHGRRQFRFRPPLPGEFVESVGPVLVKRHPDGSFERKLFDGKPTPERFVLNEDDPLCAIVWRSLEKVGVPSVMKTAGTEPPVPAVSKDQD